MARNTVRKTKRSRVEIYRETLAAVDLGLADGVFDVCRAIIRVAESRAPDAEPYGEGLVMHGGAATWLNGRKTAEMTTGYSGKVTKPRSVRVRANKITGVAGWGFPSMFLEFGTVNMPAQPFFTPAVDEVVGSEANIILSKDMERRLRGERNPKSQEIAAKITASRAAKAARLAGGGA